MDISVSLSDFIKQNCDRVVETGQSFVFSCPVSTCLSRKKLYIRKRDGQFMCFKCGFHGKPEFALSKITNMPLDLVKESVYGLSLNGEPHLEVDFDPILEEDIEESEIVIRSWEDSCLEIASPKSKLGVNYLSKRGIPLEIAKKYGIRFDVKSHRICFPVHYQSYLVGWQGRTIHDNVQPKAKTTSGLTKSKFLMFDDVNPSKDHLILCEGPIDAIKADLLGGNVATMGKMVSQDQISIIEKKNLKTLYLALDSDAYKETENLVRHFYGKIELKHIKPCSHKKDLGEMDFEEVKEAFLNAENLSPNKFFFFLK